jgi:asparagine synthase (glutamine-hydrolysing)
MCGIAGYTAPGDPAELRAALENAVGALKHRGPDGFGYHFTPDAGLGHARLAIIDLSTGDQPLFNEDRSLALVVNGEFYNYQELTGPILSAGHRLGTRSDSEVFLHLYEDLPLAEALNRLNGMWALALWDGRNRRLVLSRDRAGKKPLYYAFWRGGLIFASELKALKAFPGLDLDLDPTALYLYLRYGYVPAPYSIYRQVRKLPAAGYAVWENGRLQIGSYWRLPETIITGRSLESWTDELDHLLRDAVRLRLIADVPLGVFLSGGLDSSLIAHQASHLVQGRVRTFSIGFPDPTYDETPQARLMARHLGTDHAVDVVQMDALNELPRLAAQFDEPFADASSLPTWHLCRATRRHVTVALSGDGGDELFGGYRRYQAAKLSGSYSRLPQSLRKRLIEPFVAALPAPSGYYGRSLAKKAKLFVAAANRMNQDPGAAAPRMFDELEIQALFPGLVPPSEDQDPVRVAALESRGHGLLNQMFRTDFRAYLPDDILVKVDRMSMAHALEVRCPYLDHRIVELAHQLPVDFKIKGAITKLILRRLAHGRLPDPILRRGKQGFMAPLDAWFRGDLKEWLRAALNQPGAPWSASEALNMFERHQAGRHDHASRLWALAVLGNWRAGKR